MSKHLKRALGVLLSVVLVTSDISLVASGEEAFQEVSQDMVVENTSSLKEPEIVSELTEKRDEITKYFAMSDGTIKACIYPQHIHYLKDEKYEEIDNTLVKNDEGDTSYYENKRNSFSVKIPESFADDYIEFSDENGYVKFKLKDASNKKIKRNTKKQLSKEKNPTIAQNVNAKATFKSIKANVDVEYDVAGNKLKETIVLNKKTKKSFVFDVKTSATKIVLNNDNSVSFYGSDGIEIYTIASPYMTDMMN